MKQITTQNENFDKKTTGDRIALAILFAYFAFIAFAMNPPGWGWFDWIAVCLFLLFAVWQLIKIRW